MINDWNPVFKLNNNNIGNGFSSTGSGSLMAGNDYSLNTIGSDLENVKLPPLPDFSMPGYDYGRERNLTQQAAAPGMAKLRTGLLQALAQARYAPSGQYGYLMRNAVAGYGEGLGDVMARAGQSGRAEYDRERANESQAAMARYNAAVQQQRLRAEMAYKSALLKEQQRMGLLDMMLKQKMNNTYVLQPDKPFMPLSNFGQPATQPMQTIGQPQIPQGSTVNTPNATSEIDNFMSGNSGQLTGYAPGNTQDLMYDPSTGTWY